MLYIYVKSFYFPFYQPAIQIIGGHPYHTLTTSHCNCNIVTIFYHINVLQIVI